LFQEFKAVVFAVVAYLRKIQEKIREEEKEEDPRLHDNFTLVIAGLLVAIVLSIFFL